VSDVGERFRGYLLCIVLQARELYSTPIRRLVALAVFFTARGVCGGGSRARPGVVATASVAGGGVLAALGSSRLGGGGGGRCWVVSPFGCGTSPRPCISGGTGGAGGRWGGGRWGGGGGGGRRWGSGGGGSRCRRRRARRDGRRSAR